MVPAGIHPSNRPILRERVGREGNSLKMYLDLGTATCTAASWRQPVVVLPRWAFSLPVECHFQLDIDHAERLVDQTGGQVDRQSVGEHQRVFWPSAGLAPPVAVARWGVRTRIAPPTAAQVR
jgi:hypothetical protein